MSLHEDVLRRDEFLDLFNENLTEIQELALQELGESQENRARALKELTEMIHEQGDVVPHRMDEEFLIRFLRAKYLDVASSYALMANYYNFKKNNPKLCKRVSLTEANLHKICDEEVVSVLHNRDQLGRRVIIYNTKRWNPSVMGVDEILKASLLVLELSVLEQQTQILGGVCLFDMEGLSLRQAMQITPKVASNIVQLMGRGFPIRVREVHILNQPRIFDVIFAMFKPFLDETTRARVHFHGRSYESLHSFVEPKYLPEVYGGTRPHCHAKDWIENLLTFPSVITELTSVGYVVAADDESLSQSKEGKR